MPVQEPRRISSSTLSAPPAPTALATPPFNREGGEHGEMGLGSRLMLLCRNPSLTSHDFASVATPLELSCALLDAPFLLQLLCLLLLVWSDT
jgi:hypothetical protein